MNFGLLLECMPKHLKYFKNTHQLVVDNAGGASLFVEICFCLNCKLEWTFWGQGRGLLKESL